MSRIHGFRVRNGPAPGTLQFFFDWVRTPTSLFDQSVKDSQDFLLGVMGLKAFCCYRKAAQEYMSNAAVFRACSQTTDFISMTMLHFLHLHDIVKSHGMRFSQQNVCHVVEHLSDNCGSLGEPMHSVSHVHFLRNKITHQILGKADFKSACHGSTRPRGFIDRGIALVHCSHREL